MTNAEELDATAERLVGTLLAPLLHVGTLLAREMDALKVRVSDLEEYTRETREAFPERFA